jgi:hypothetical protein
MAKQKQASEMIDDRIRDLRDWRGETLSNVRRIIRDADPDIVEEWKWVKPTNPGTPVWSHNGGFFKGASLKDPSHLFNSSLDGKVRRAIDIKEQDKIKEGALKKLVREAVALNLAG